MIEEVGVRSKCLDIKLLDYGMEDLKFCKISKVVQKFTIEGNPYIRMTIKDINGNPIVGRMFDDVDNFLSIWSGLENSIALVRYSTSNYQGRMCLDVKSVNKPELKMQALLNEESFDQTYSLLEESINIIKSIKADDTDLNNYYNSVIKSSTFDSLMYYSDDDILGNVNGGILGVISMVADTLKSYCAFHHLTPDEVVIMLTALITVQSAIVKDYSGNIMLKNVTVYSKVLSVKALTGKYSSMLLNVTMSYCNLCFGIKDNVSPLAQMLYNVYNEKLSTLKVIHTMKNYTVKSGDCLEIDNVKYYKD